MKQTISILALIILSTSQINAQNRVMSFDGVNDYIDLGSTVGGGIRTIEMWFKPNVSINPNNNNFKTLVSRDNTTISNANEFNISFVPSSIGSSVAGKLRFGVYDNNSSLYAVYSNNNIWNAGQWYHIAAVIHPSLGMMLFIDGIKQTSSNNFTFATGQLNHPVTSGSWGNIANRFFDGSIDDLRFSDSALYAVNFSPSCPHLGVLPSTIGVWNFNDSSNAAFSIDSSSNAYNGVNYGAMSVTEDVCLSPTASNAIYFDGIDDYISLGSAVGTGIRTIEMWFKPNVSINSTVNNFKALVARDNAITTANEFNLSFFPAVATPTSAAGKLRFTVHDNNTTEYSVYSDSNLWRANQWYHIAAVVHPSQGMMLFIDGIKQTSTNNYIFAPVQSSNPVTIGSWGTAANRFFNGSIDDLRFSSTGLYTSNFTPPCPDAVAVPSTIGVWNFNDSSNTMITIDSSGNMNNGIIYGAIGVKDTVCQITTSINEVEDNLQLVKVFPNPFRNQITIKFNNSSIPRLISLYSIDGRLIIKKQVSSFVTIGTEGLAKGLYFVQVIESGQVVVSQKLIKE